MRPAEHPSVRVIVERLAGLASSTAIDRSDSWSELDLQEFTTASVRSVEAADKEDS